MRLFSIGRGESLASFRPSFRYVFANFFQGHTYAGRHAHTLPSFLFSSLPPTRIRRAYVGLDGLDHLGLGGALWRTRSVFGHGVHTRHHRRYVVLLFHTPRPSATIFYTISSCIVGGAAFLKRSAYFAKSHRVRTICARVRNYGASPRSESCSSVRGIWRLMRARWHASLSKSSSTIIAPSYRRISIHEIVRRSQLDFPCCRLCTHHLYSQRLHPMARTL